MNELKEIDDGQEYLSKYWEGAGNKFVRYWTYLRLGMTLFNEWKNYILLAFGSYWTIKTSDAWLGLELGDSWLIVGFVVGMPLGLLALLLLGHWQMYRAAKPQEYITNQKASLVGYKPYNTQVRTLRVLEEINKKLNVKRRK